MPFHGWGLGTNPLRHLALLDASSPEGGAFCALSPAGRGTILNGLRCALAMFSGKIILNFRVWHTRVCAAMKAPVGLLSGRAVCVSRWRGFAPTSSAERDRRFFHRRGRSRELHLQRLLPAEVRRCGGTPLPAFALSLQACKKLPLSGVLANAVSLRGFSTQKSRCTKSTTALILCNLY